MDLRKVEGRWDILLLAIRGQLMASQEHVFARVKTQFVINLHTTSYLAV
jgi:hypothetical protein